MAKTSTYSRWVSVKATLTVQTDEPGLPGVEVPLVASQNLPPRLTWVSPSADDIVGPGSELVVAVEDENDTFDDLVVRWSSDVDGTVAVGFGDETGQARAVWGEATGGDHTLTATVTDTCGATSSADVSICQRVRLSKGPACLRLHRRLSSAMGKSTRTA